MKRTAISGITAAILSGLIFIITIFGGVGGIAPASAEYVGSTGGASFPRENLEVSEDSAKQNFGNDNIPSVLMNQIDQDVYTEVEYCAVDLSVYVGGFKSPSYRLYGNYKVAAEKHLIIEFNFGSENVDNIANYIKVYGFKYCVENGLLGENDYIVTYYYRIALDFKDIFAEKFYCNFAGGWGDMYISPRTNENYFLSYYDCGVIDYYLLQDIDSEGMSATLLFIPTAEVSENTEFTTEERPYPLSAFSGTGDFIPPNKPEETQPDGGDGKDDPKDPDNPPEDDWNWETDKPDFDGVSINRTLSPIAYELYVKYYVSDGSTPLSKLAWAKEQSGALKKIFDNQYRDYFPEWYNKDIFSGIEVRVSDDGTYLYNYTEVFDAFRDKLDSDDTGFAVIYLYEANSEFDNTDIYTWAKAFGEDNVKNIYSIYADKVGEGAIPYTEYKQSLSSIILKYYPHTNVDGVPDWIISDTKDDNKNPSEGDDNKDHTGDDNADVTKKEYNFTFPPSVENLKNLVDPDFWKALVSGEVGGWENLIWAILLLLAILILLPILSIFFPIIGTVIKAIFRGIGIVLKYLFKALWWVICLPFKGIAALIKRGKSDSEGKKKEKKDKPEKKNTKPKEKKVSDSKASSQPKKERKSNVTVQAQEVGGAGKTYVITTYKEKK